MSCLDQKLLALQAIRKRGGRNKVWGLEKIEKSINGGVHLAPESGIFRGKYNIALCNCHCPNSITLKVEE